MSGVSRIGGGKRGKEKDRRGVPLRVGSGWKAMHYAEKTTSIRALDERRKCTASSYVLLCWPAMIVKKLNS